MTLPTILMNSLEWEMKKELVHIAQFLTTINITHQKNSSLIGLKRTLRIHILSMERGITCQHGLRYNFVVSVIEMIFRTCPNIGIERHDLTYQWQHISFII